MNRPHTLLQYGLMLLAAFLSAVGWNIEHYHDFLYEGDHAMLYFVLGIGFFFVCFEVFTYFFSRYWSVEKVDALIPNWKLWDRKWMFLYIVLVDTLLLVLVYPGIEGGLDTQYQIQDFLDGNSRIYYFEGDTYITCSLNDHHPVLTSIIYGGFTWLGMKIGHPMVGSFVLNFLQILCFSASFVYATDYMASLNEKFRKMTAIYYMFYPIFLFYSVTMVKDSIYCWLFLIYYILFLKIYDGAAGKKELWWFVGLSVLLPLTKKTAVYILCVANLVLIVRAFRQKRSNTFKLSTVSSVVLPALVMFILLPSVIFPAFNVYPGGKQEVYGALFQQTARLKYDHPEAFTEEDVAVIDKVLKYDQLESQYRYYINDMVKRLIRTDTMTDEDFNAYLHTWWRQGKEHPKTYLKATLGVCNSSFAPTRLMDVYSENDSYETQIPQWENTFKEKLYGFYNTFRDIPIIELLFQLVTFSFWMPLAAFCWIITRKGWKHVFLLLPIFMTQLTFIVSPLFFTRYVLPLIFCAPLILTLHYHDTEVSKGP